MKTQDSHRGPKPFGESARDADRSGTMKTPPETEDSMPDFVMPDRPKTQATMLPGGAIVQAPIPEEPPETPEELARKAEHLSIVMAYEAMRICLGHPTKYHRPEAVLRWMELMAKGETHCRVGPDGKPREASARHAWVEGITDGD
jgi:hypothetical protein